MAHGNGFDNSFHDLPPIRRVRHLQSVPQPQFGWIGLGAFTGEAFAVGVFHGPSEPALAAFDYRDGSILWTSPLGDLPVVRQGRQVSGILMAKLGAGDGSPLQRRVFAGNQHEFVAYDENGTRVWKRRVAELLPEAGAGFGTPRSFSITADKALVVATSGGWIVKLCPVDGGLLDAYHMRTQVAVNGRLYRGFFYTGLSSVTIGNVLYLVVNFRPDDKLPDGASPVFLVRIDLLRPGSRSPESHIGALAEPGTPHDLPPDRIEIAAAGQLRFAGSPVGMIGTGGHPIIIAATPMVLAGQTLAAIVAVEDRNGVLAQRWHCALTSVPGEVVVAAPALYAAGGLYVVPTHSGIHLFERVDEMSGAIQPARFIRADALLTPEIRARAAVATVTSPISIAIDRQANEFVAYANVNVRQSAGGAPYGFLTAVAAPLAPQGAHRALWSEALVRGAAGQPMAAPGTYGQPALFRYPDRSGMATGIILNTYANGTVILR